MVRVYRKKPVAVEAVQWVGGNFMELREWGAPVRLPESGWGLLISTLEDGPNGEAKHVASLNDFIIKGIKGEFYACKPDIFEATYEPTISD